MTLNASLPETHHIVRGLVPAADAAGRTSDWVSMKNVGRMFVICYLDQGNAAQVTFTLLQATLVDGTGSKAITNDCPIWVNQDLATSDVLTRTTDAKVFQTSTAVKNKMVVFQVDPSALDVNNDFDCLAVSTSASNAANITSVLFVGDSYYKQETLPSIIVD